MTIEVGRLYRAQLGLDDLEDWSYVLVSGQVGDKCACHRISLLIDDTEVLQVSGQDITEIPLLKPEEFTDGS